MKSLFLGAASVAAAFALVPSAASAQCVGTCGSSAGTDGVVTGAHSWVVTNPGVSGVGLGQGDETIGSTFTTLAFTANGTDELQFDFNYITSDGAGFADYAWVELLSGASALTLFTARTTPSGDTVPGFSLPGLAPGVTLTPASTPIIGGAPTWSPLGQWNGLCFSSGCGYTDWIKMTYTPAAGTYRLRFGVVNWSDSVWSSGLAWRGALIGDKPIEPGIPEPGTWAMLIAGFGMIGAAARRRRIAVAA
ncbi:NF038132 family protein [Thermaurantiacus sp.]